MSLTGTDMRNLCLAALAFAVCALLPLGDNGYWLGLGVTIAMFTALATSWALFSGPTHYISLATAAFFGVGTYVTGLGIETLPFWSLVGLAGVIGALLAALVGLATLRLSGVYFVIFTLGLAELVRQVIPFTFLLEAVSSNFPNQTTLVIGVAFLVIVYLLPGGFVGLLDKIMQRINAREGS